MRVAVTSLAFDPHAETMAFTSGRCDAGALVSFVGLCRDATDGTSVSELHLEEYKGFTEREIERIVAEAVTRYGLLDALVIHRTGAINPGEAIVLVVTLSLHRGPAFEAANMLMDYLKTDAPLWKRENGPDGARWIEPTADDYVRRHKDPHS